MGPKMTTFHCDENLAKTGEIKNGVTLFDQLWTYGGYMDDLYLGHIKNPDAAAASADHDDDDDYYTH